MKQALDPQGELDPILGAIQALTKFITDALGLDKGDKSNQPSHSGGSTAGSAADNSQVTTSDILLANEDETSGTSGTTKKKKNPYRSASVVPDSPQYAQALQTFAQQAEHEHRRAGMATLPGWWKSSGTNTARLLDVYNDPEKGPVTLGAAAYFVDVEDGRIDVDAMETLPMRDAETGEPIQTGSFRRMMTAIAQMAQELEKKYGKPFVVRLEAAGSGLTKYFSAMHMDHQGKIFTMSSDQQRQLIAETQQKDQAG